MQSRMRVADNSGAKIIQCIRPLGGSFRRVAAVGDIIVASVKEASPGSEIKEGQVVKAVIVRTRFPIKRSDGMTVRFDDNAAVIINAQKEPSGTRVFGVVAREVKAGFAKIASLAEGVI